MKVFRPGLPPVFTDEDAPNQPAPPKAVKPDAKANPFVTPEEAMRLAQARHIAANGQLPQQPAPVAPVAPVAPAANTTQTAPSPNPGASGAPATTEIIPPVAPQPLIDNNKPPVAPPPVAPPPAPKQPELEVNTSTELTPEEEAELDALLAKRDHPHTETPHS